MKKNQLHPGAVAIILIVVIGVTAATIYKLTNTPITTGLEGGGFPAGDSQSKAPEKDKKETVKSSEPLGSKALTAEKGKDTKTK